MARDKHLMILGAVLGMAIMLVGWQAFGRPYSFQGSLIDPATPAMNFELVDQHGDSFRLDEQKGKVVLIFFGYTNCPDVCPVTLTEFKQIKEELCELSDQVRFVFITVDPERDTRQRIRQHLANFDPEFVGLGGSREELEPVWKSYGVYQDKQETGSAAGYVVDHTARVYAIDKQGNLRLTYPFEMEMSAMLDDVRYLVRQ